MMNTPKKHTKVGRYPQATSLEAARFTICGAALSSLMRSLFKVEKLQSMTEEQVATITITVEVAEVKPVSEAQPSVSNPQDVEWQF